MMGLIDRVEAMETTHRAHTKRLAALERRRAAFARSPLAQFATWSNERVLAEYRALLATLRNAGRRSTGRYWQNERTRVNRLWLELGRRGLTDAALDVQRGLSRE